MTKKLTPESLHRLAERREGDNKSHALVHADTLHDIAMEWKADLDELARLRGLVKLVERADRERVIPNYLSDALATLEQLPEERID